MTVSKKTRFDVFKSRFDCNRGKRDKPLSSVPGTLADQQALVAEREEQLKQYRAFVRRQRKRIDCDIAKVDAVYKELTPGRELTQQFKEVSIREFLKWLTAEQLVDNMRLADSRIRANRRPEPGAVTKYFCGI